MRKKVLLLVAGDNGTIGSCSLNLYEALKQTENIEVRCAIVHHFENSFEGFIGADYFDKSHGEGLRRQVEWLRNVKKDFKPDVTISTLFGVSTLSVLSGGQDRKIGIFHSPHKQIKAFGTKNYLLTLLQYTFIYPFLDKLCCVSHEVYNSLSVFRTISNAKKSVVYNVHNIERIRQLALMPIANEIENRIFKNPTFLYCGRLDGNKAPDRTLKAFVKADLPKDSQLVFIGEDQDCLTVDLKDMVKDYGVEDRVHFFGRKSNPYPYFKRAKALISSSYSEGLPGVMIEALALDTPVVTTNSSEGIWEIFSCHIAYNPYLDSIFETECGIISSNLSRDDSTKYADDISNLAESIWRVAKRNYNIKFDFEKKVIGNYIVNRLLSGNR